MNTQWQSKRFYRLRGNLGIIELSKAGIYVFRFGACRSSCPQEWASKIHYEEISLMSKGRPKIGEIMLPGLTVSAELSQAIKTRAAVLGISLPNARREAYHKFSA